MSMIELKTSVLVAGSAMMGAILGGADEEQSRRLYQFAIELGMAFQLQDDLLDSYGGEGVGQDHRRRHSRREEELSDGHGHEPCR